MQRVAGVVCGAAIALGASACASGTAYTICTENDYFGLGDRDRYYTNGLRVSGLHRAEATPDLVRDLAESLPALAPQATTQVGWVAGQDVYTPSDTQPDPPDPADRPYAGWLCAGVLVSKAVQAEDGPAADFVDVVDLGVVGPQSLAEQAQTSCHHAIGLDRPQGWRHQLGFEPGVVLQYEHRHRLAAGEEALLGGSWDVIGMAGANVGNVFTHASALARWGSGLRRDFGPNTIHSTAVDVPDGVFVDSPRGCRFAGAEGRAGIALEWRSFRVAYTHVLRTKEFRGQPDREAYGSISLTWEVNF